MQRYNLHKKNKRKHNCTQRFMHVGYQPNTIIYNDYSTAVGMPKQQLPVIASVDILPGLIKLLIQISLLSLEESFIFLIFFFLFSHKSARQCIITSRYVCHNICSRVGSWVVNDTCFKMEQTILTCQTIWSHINVTLTLTLTLFLFQHRVLNDKSPEGDF